MIKKEFIKRMSEIKRKNFDYDLEYTCEIIYDEFYSKGIALYRQIIYPYISEYGAVIDDAYLDSKESRKTVRILALTTFEIECLESGIYKEF